MTPEDRLTYDEANNLAAQQEFDDFEAQQGVDLDALKVQAAEFVDAVEANEEFRVVPNRVAKRRHLHGFTTTQLTRSRVRRSRHRIRKQKSA